jgi:hypothetical protein
MAGNNVMEELPGRYTHGKNQQQDAGNKLFYERVPVQFLLHCCKSMFFLINMKQFDHHKCF